MGKLVLDLVKGNQTFLGNLVILAFNITKKTFTPVAECVPILGLNSQKFERPCAKLKSIILKFGSYNNLAQLAECPFSFLKITPP